MHQPPSDHLEAALKVVKYLKRTFGYIIMFKRGEYLEIHGYKDVDCAENPVDRRSTTGYFIFVGGNIVT